MNKKKRHPFYKRAKQNLTKKNNIVAKSFYDYDYSNRCLQVKIEFNKAETAWNKNKIKLYSPNGFFVGYIYK